MTPSFPKAVLLLSLSVILAACKGEEDDGDNQSISNSCFDLETSKQEMIQLINDARSQARTCGVYGNFPAAGNVSWNDKLFKAANAHSQDMAKENFFSHTGSDGLAFSDRIKAAGYSYSSAAENIAAGQSTTQAVVNAWLGSDGHCKNIMGSSYTEIGSACVSSESADYKTYWTLLLARPQ
ncbi:CAP domain-containing protein [Oceanospirillum sanctuarii]|uniref:CAP domain-containing protein n=1 Tax=Oceanospirillum sanctuarii TaxID=1434821 RepID=UPI001C3CC8F1|nr:CAP domain-containing protein [Oceanospirillum sanctuarii]